MSTMDRASKASAVAQAMREAYEAAGEEGDFDDALRYLRNDASDAELDAEYAKWVENKP